MQKLNLSPLKLVLILLISIISFSCNKEAGEPNDDDDNYICTSCTSTPEAVAANNKIKKGIYKGVLIGSSGTLIFNLQNTSNTITGTMVIDGNVVNLTCEGSVDLDGSADFEESFTGTLNGSPVIIRFYVAKDGANPAIVSATIPGHPGAVLIVAKETSDTLLECYEGTYTITDDDGTEKGTYNFLIARKNGGGAWEGINAEDGYPEEFSYGKGYISGKEIVQPDRLGDGKDAVIGTINGDTISGHFVDDDGNGDKATVDHKGKRTL